MVSKKPNILFFSRTQYSYLYPKLISSLYNSYHVVVNIEEKIIVEKLGGIVVGCFEEEFKTLRAASIKNFNLNTSFYADRFLGFLSLDERHKILAKEIAFWERIFNERKYSLCVHDLISFELQEVMALTAKEYSCENFTIESCVMDGFFYQTCDPYHSSFASKKFNNIITEKLRDLVTEYLHQVKEKGHKPGYVFRCLPKNSYYRILKSLIGYEYRLIRRFGLSFSNETEKQNALFYYQNSRCIFYRNIRERIRSVNKKYDNLNLSGKHKIILYPMHEDPEAKLLYFDPNTPSQHHILQEIAKNIPLDCLLAVKEHPLQPGHLMRIEYQDLKRRNSNIIFLPAEINTCELYSRVHSVITVSGSVGWEALINNIPVIVLSDVFYDTHPSVINIKLFSDLKKIYSNTFSLPKNEDTIEFLCNLLSECWFGNPTDPIAYNDLQNIKNLTQAIELKILSNDGG